MIFLMFIFNIFLLVYNTIEFWCKGTDFLQIITIHKISQYVQKCRFFYLRNPQKQESPTDAVCEGIFYFFNLYIFTQSISIFTGN